MMAISNKIITNGNHSVSSIIGNCLNNEMELYHLTIKIDKN